jgi:hypothetical protein
MYNMYVYVCTYIIIYLINMQKKQQTNKNQHSQEIV